MLRPLLKKGGRDTPEKKTNSHLNASNITIKSSEDTLVRGGVVRADNDLTLDVGGNLKVESIQDVNKSHSVTVGLSGGAGGKTDSGSVDINSGNGGVNLNISKSDSKWVTEQTSLTSGGNVDIDVENKTTLRGAVIASDTGDLTFETGSFEYSHIKDKDKSYNVGGGGNFGGSDSWSANTEYGFSDKRQTNFATIGEGTITIRDGSSIGTPDQYSGLKRDVSQAQYSTKEGGLQGGFVIDSTTVNFVTNFPETISKTADKVGDGLTEAKNTSVLIYKEADKVAEKTGNLLDVGEFGLDTDSNVLNAKFQRMWESEEVQKVLLAYNDEGNTTTSYSAYLKNNLFITTDENGEPMIGHKEVSFMGKQVTREDVEIAIQRGNLSVEEANKLRDAYGFGSKDRNSIEGNESVFVRKLREQGVIIKSDGSGNGLMGVPIDQTKIGSEVDKYLCPFSSALGMGKAISGDGVLTLSETKKQYKVSVEKGYIIGKETKSYDGIMGLEINNKDYTYTLEKKGNFNLPIKKDDIEMNKRIINNLNDGLPVLGHFNSGDKNKQHKQYILDYKINKDDGDLYYKAVDSGNWNDKLVKASSLQAYHEEGGAMKETKLKDGTKRILTNVSIVEKVAKKKTEPKK